MIDLALAVLCSVAIGVIFKYTGGSGIDRTALLTVNYASAVAVALTLIWVGGRSTGDGLQLTVELFGLGCGVGALLIAGFFLLSYATDVAGMTLAIGVMRVSVVIPFLASWLVWQETPSVPQGIGLSLAGAAFFLIAHRHRNPNRALGVDSSERDRGFASGAFRSIDWHAFVVLALTFCVGGAVDLSMKAFEESLGATNSRVLFLLFAFGMAMLIGAAVVVLRGVRFGRWPGRDSVGWGVVLGIVNYGSLEFLLRAIADLPGPFVFPANNIAIMVLSAGLGVYVWSERLTVPNRVGIGIAVIALVLLRL